MRKVKVFGGILALLSLLFVNQANLKVEAIQGGSLKLVKNGNVEIQIPAESSSQQVKIEIKKRPNLSQFKTPSGFVLVSDLYKLDTSKLSLTKNEEILLKLKISSSMIPARYKFQNLSIYYLDYKTKRLEEICWQKSDARQMSLTAALGYHKYDLVIGTNIRTISGTIAKKSVPKSNGKHCEGGICPL